jgi:O-antigen/teichoic acid export membrane protein
MTTPLKEPIQRRALKTTIVGGVSFVTGSVLSFGSVPICLRAWGSDRYGAWLALLAGFLLLRTIDTGFVNYVGNQLNILYHEDEARMRRSLASSLQVSIGLGVAEILVWAMLWGSGRLNSLLGLSSTEIDRYQLGASLGVLLIASAFSGAPFGVLSRVYTPIGMLYQASWWGIVAQTALLLGQIGAALAGMSILQAACIYAVMQILCSVASAVYLRRVAPQFVPWWRGGDSRTGANDFFRSLFLTLNGVGQQATTSGLVVLVSTMFGAASVPLFTTVRTLANLWTTVANLFASPLVPEIVRFHGTREHEKLFKGFYAHWFFSGLVVNVSMLAALPFIDTFYALWTRGQLQFDRSLFLFTMSSVSLINFGSALAIYLLGINNLVAQLVTTATRAGVIFAVSFVLVPWMGMRGFGIAMLVAELICSVGLGIYFTNKELEKFGVRLPLRHIGLALLGTLPIQFLAIESTIVGHVHLLSWLVAAVAISCVAWVSWKHLDEDVKTRTLLLLRRS